MGGIDQVVSLAQTAFDEGDFRRAAIPRSLPPFTLPDLGTVPALTSGAVAIALVALAQAAGVGSAVPNPDGSKPDTSTDFTAQGLANLAGGFFGALPTGGSRSRTGVNSGAGATTRWAGVFAGLHPATRDYLVRTQPLTGLDERNLIAATDDLMASLEAGVMRAEELRTHTD